MSTCIKDLDGYGLVKKCRVCKKISLKSNFHKSNTKRDGSRSQCLSCCKKIIVKIEINY